jgi:hypothetical protein
MNGREANDYMYFNLVASKEHLEEYSRFIDEASRAADENDLELAEAQYRKALRFAEKTWGTYCWMAGSALMHLTNVLDLQGRIDEADVTEALCARILASGEGL